MTDGPVPLSDLEIADRIVRAATTGPPGDREPTVGQLLAAFDEPDATDRARRRVAAALGMAGATVSPDLLETAVTERVRITPDEGAGRARSPALRAGLAAAALAGVIAIAAVLAGHHSAPQTVDKSLPPGTTATHPHTTPRKPVRTTPPPAATATTPVKTTPVKTTPAKPRRHRIKKPPKTPKRTVDGKPKASALAIKHGVTVRLTPTVPSYVCVDNARGKVLFSGTLSAPMRFRGHHIRVNIGLSSVKLQVNGKVVPITDSPSGYDIDLHHVSFVPVGNRPCSNGG